MLLFTGMQTKDIPYALLPSPSNSIWKLPVLIDRPSISHAQDSWMQLPGLLTGTREWEYEMKRNLSGTLFHTIIIPHSCILIFLQQRQCCLFLHSACYPSSTRRFERIDLTAPAVVIHFPHLLPRRHLVRYFASSIHPSLSYSHLPRVATTHFYLRYHVKNTLTSICARCRCPVNAVPVCYGCRW